MIEDAGHEMLEEMGGKGEEPILTQFRKFLDLPLKERLTTAEFEAFQEIDDAFRALVHRLPLKHRLTPEEWEAWREAESIIYASCEHGCPFRARGECDGTRPEGECTDHDVLAKMRAAEEAQ